jgi:hypothetical protein
MREPYPLQWPERTERTKVRQKSRFGVGGHVNFSTALDDLRNELRMLGAVNAVLTSDLPLRGDGLPYANGRAEDPGIAVWFLLPDDSGELRELVFACDRYLTHAANMTAVARTIEALRGIERWGVAEAKSRAFSGFAALPPGSSGTIDDATSGPVKRPWREVLGGSWASGLSASELLLIAKSRYRTLMKEHHPDRPNANAALAAELNLAMEDAERELGGTGE